MTDRLLRILATALIETALSLSVSFAANPMLPVAEDECDYIERNHVMDRDSGEQVLCQWIFWERMGSEFRVRAWRMDKGQTLIRTRDGYKLVYHEGDQLHLIHSPCFCETWGAVDPEIEDRRFLPPEFRSALYEAKRTVRVVEVVP